MAACPVCRKQTQRSRLDVQFPGTVLGLTRCVECHVVIGAQTGTTSDPVAIQLRDLEQRLTKLERKVAGA